MALFQKPAATPEEVEAGRPLDIPPATVAEMSEEEWYARAYRGDDAPQLTARAVLLGSFLGFLLAFTNLYIGLKTGWHVGVAITACIMSYALWGMLMKVGLARTQLSILENNCMQSTASAAGYSTGATMISAIPALLLLTVTPENPGGTHLRADIVALWTLFLAILGVVLAIPMKRSLINRERLPFPSGLAAAVTLQSLYAAGAEAAKKARALLWSGVVGAVIPLLIDLNLKSSVDAKGVTSREPLLPGTLNLFDWLPGRGTHPVDGVATPNKPSDWTIVWDVNPVMFAAGALVGLRTSVWMTVGGLALAYAVGPAGLEWGWVNSLGKEVFGVSAPGKAWREVGLWVGAPILVSSGVLAFVFQWKTILRAFQGMLGGGAAQEASPTDAVEVPNSWFGIGVLIAGGGVVAIAHLFFEVPFHYGVLAVIMTLALCMVAARATGESDITPTGAMGKIMQLTYGVLIPQSVTANLMTAGITSGSASSCADLLTDLKSGYLLGANPRRQFIAQAAGILSGTLATVTGYYILVPDATALTGVDGKAPAFPAPSAQAWKAVAEVFRTGIENLHPMHREAIGVGLAIGALLVLAEKLLPAFRRYLPSATGLGLGFILPFQYPLSMLAGAIVAAVWTARAPKSAEDYVIPVSSGLIAGVSILGVIVAALNNFVLK